MSACYHLRMSFKGSLPLIKHLPVRACLQPLSKRRHKGFATSCSALFNVKSTSPTQEMMASADALKNNSVNRRLIAGQPTAESHPHLLQAAEVTVGITFEEYKNRRASIMELLCKQEGRHHVLILPAMPKRFMIEKIPFLFRQDTDFLYCSGCLEPDCVLVVHTLPSSVMSSSPSHKAVMFCPEVSPAHVVWDGPRTSAAYASQVFGVDEGLPLSELTRYLTSIEHSLQSPTVWYHHKDPHNPSTHRTLQRWLSEGRAAGLECPKTHLHRARLVKSLAEQSLMRQACRISAEAMRSTMAWSRPNITEHELFAKVDYESRVRGANHLAYPPVVAGAHRANIIHYINNNHLVPDGEMVLMDAGGEYHGYSGDVSRTWPVNGSFSSAQKELYEAVLHVQTIIINTLNNTRPSLDQLYRMMCNELIKVLLELGIISQIHSSEQRLKIATALCPHNVSHYLGMDVHDTPSIPRHEPIVPGSVLTVEPGLYVPPGCSLSPSRFHGLGIRIEDDILIHCTGCEVLSSSCPKTPHEIEALMRRSNDQHGSLQG